MENEEIYEEFTEPVEEVNEENQEQIIVDDSGSNNSDTVVDDNSISENEINDSLEELLKEYIKTTISENEEEGDDISENDIEDIEDKESEIIEQIDYTELLQDISDKSDVINDTQEQIYLRSIEVDENNTMLSGLEDISLTNQLLLFIFIAILFTGVIEFTRRLF